MQVTFKGAPLYTFTQDSKAGPTNGEGFKDVAVRPRDHGRRRGSPAAVEGVHPETATESPRPGAGRLLDWPLCPGP